MDLQHDTHRVLALYPDDCRPRSLEPLVSPESFSGARVWRLATDRGPLALRRWPKGHPDAARLQFIQAVLWHVDQEGFHTVPLPLETRHHHGYVWHAGHLWELAPWLPGAADYHQQPSPARLRAAMAALASFHNAAALFPLPETGPIFSPGIAQRLERLEMLLSTGLDDLRAAVRPDPWPELAARAEPLLARVAQAAPQVLLALKGAAPVRVRLQPCIRDVWHPHVLFVGDEVTGIVDFGSMRPENVAADVARLLGSLAGDNPRDWQIGLDAYQAVRPLDDDERSLVPTFDRSTVLMGGLQWLQWVYLEHRTFTSPPAAVRMDWFLARLTALCQTLE